MCSYVDQLKKYQNFEDVDQLKKAFNLFRKAFRSELTKADNDILFKMTGYAFKFPGACKLKLETIAEITGYSLSTVKRTIEKSAKLGILKRINNRKDNGRRKGANVYQFQKFVSGLYDEPKTMNQRRNIENPCESKEKAMKNETEALSSLNPSLSFKNTNITKKHTENKRVDKELFKKNALLDKLPEALRGLSVYFDNSQDIYNIAGVIFRAKDEVCKNIRVEDYTPLFRKTIASVYEYWKRQVENGNVDYNVFGLMRKAIRELTAKITAGTAYQVKKYVSQTYKRKIENVPAWIQNKVYAFGNTRSELIPDWFENRNENTKTANENIDFEIERQKVLAKLFG